MKTRSTWFPALWVGGEGESVRSNVVKTNFLKIVKSDECNFSGWMLKSPRTTTGVPSSGKQLRRASIEEVAERARWTVDHCNVELDGKGDCHSVEFKCRSTTLQSLGHSSL